MGSQAASDEVLVARVRSGDRDAFEALYRQYVKLVQVVVRDQVHDREAVPEVVQEVFVRCLERLDSLREPARFQYWLTAIARHTAIDHRRRLRHTESLDVESEHERCIAPDDPCHDAELAELADLVKGLLAGLNQREAVAITLVMQFGCGPTEVGAALGMNANAAKVMLHRARRKMRDALIMRALVRRSGDTCGQALRTTDQHHVATHLQSCFACAAVARDELRLAPAAG